MGSGVKEAVAVLVVVIWIASVVWVAAKEQPASRITRGVTQIRKRNCIVKNYSTAVFGDKFQANFVELIGNRRLQMVFLLIRSKTRSNGKEENMSGIVYVFVAIIGLLFGAMSLTSWKK